MKRSSFAVGTLIATVLAAIIMVPSGAAPGKDQDRDKGKDRDRGKPVSITQRQAPNQTAQEIKPGFGASTIDRTAPSKPIFTAQQQEITQELQNTKPGFGATARSGFFTTERTEPNRTMTMSAAQRRESNGTSSQQENVRPGFGVTSRNGFFSTERTPPDRPTNNQQVNNNRPTGFDNSNIRSIWDMIREAKDKRKEDNHPNRKTTNINIHISIGPQPRFVNGYYYYDSVRFISGFGCRYGNWAFAYYPRVCVPSAYFYYGIFPYVPYTRVIFVDRPVYVVVEKPIVIQRRYSDDDYYLAARTSDPIDIALSDIRSAWIRNDADLLLKHVKRDSQIDVMLDGEYAYTVPAEDYMDMTSDAISSTETTSFEYDSVRSRGSSRVIAYATHTYIGTSGSIRRVYVSYLLERSGNRYYIIEVGSSTNPLVI